MSKKPSRKTSPKSTPSNTLKVAQAKADESQEEMYARIAIRPAAQAALTLTAYNKGLFGELSLVALAGNLSEQCERASEGDLSCAEAMLTAQAHTLDSIFNAMAQRAAHNLGHCPETVQLYLRLALKAQSQSARTLEILAGIKNPPIVYAKQANVTTGPQQVNNGTAVNASRTGNIQKPPSKLLEQQHEQWVDTGAPATASGTDKEMATVGAIDRPQGRSRQATGGA